MRRCARPLRTVEFRPNENNVLRATVILLSFAGVALIPKAP